MNNAAQPPNILNQLGGQVGQRFQELRRTRIGMEIEAGLRMAGQDAMNIARRLKDSALDNLARANIAINRVNENLNPVIQIDRKLRMTRDKIEGAKGQNKLARRFNQLIIRLSGELPKEGVPPQVIKSLNIRLSDTVQEFNDKKSLLLEYAESIATTRPAIANQIRIILAEAEATLQQFDAAYGKWHNAQDVNNYKGRRGILGFDKATARLAQTQEVQAEPESVIDFMTDQPEQAAGASEVQDPIPLMDIPTQQEAETRPQLERPQLSIVPRRSDNLAQPETLKETIDLKGLPEMIKKGFTTDEILYGLRNGLTTAAQLQTYREVQSRLQSEAA